MADFNCPACGADIPATGSASQLGTEAGSGEKPARQHARCPECGSKLERKVNPPGDEWQLQRDDPAD